MRLILLIASLVFYSLCSNAQYAFTGNGSWSDVNNWQNGVKPPPSISSGVTVTIQGTATTTSGTTPDITANSGTITIAVGGSLAINNSTQFSNQGSVIVDGILTNNSNWEAYAGSSITVNGTFENKLWLGNQGLITINTNGIINNTGTLDNTFVNPGQITMNCGTINNTSPGVFKAGNISVSTCSNINNSSTISGNGVVGGNLTNAGVLSPGNSPGLYTVGGDYTATSSAIHNFEIAGTTASQYDRLVVNGNLNLNGTLNVSLIAGFSPSTSHDLAIMSGTVSGSFSTVNIPSSYVLIYNGSSVVLSHSQTLPVTLIDFKADKQIGGIRLEWNVAAEKDVFEYQIERSGDARQFSKIGTIAASGQDRYSFIDKEPVSKGFYRIKSVDVRGSFSYSPVLKVINGQSLVLLNAFSSPLTNELIIQHPVTSSRSVILIYSIDGRKIISAFPGSNEQQAKLNISHLKSGVYVIQYANGEQTQNLKFIKQ